MSKHCAFRTGIPTSNAARKNRPGSDLHKVLLPGACVQPRVRLKTPVAHTRILWWQSPLMCGDSGGRTIRSGYGFLQRLVSSAAAAPLPHDHYHHQHPDHSGEYCRYQPVHMRICLRLCAHTREPFHGQAHGVNAREAIQARTVSFGVTQSVRTCAPATHPRRARQGHRSIPVHPIAAARAAHWRLQLGKRRQRMVSSHRHTVYIVARSLLEHQVGLRRVGGVDVELARFVQAAARIARPRDEACMSRFSRGCQALSLLSCPAGLS